MLSHTPENQWIRRTKWLTQVLIISGTLNIGLIATFVYFVLKDKETSLALEHKPNTTQELLTNAALIKSYSLLPYQELLLRLENKDLLEEGLTKRDLSLACLVAFHHFNLDKALGSVPLQKRLIPFTNNDGQETIAIPVFPGLVDSQFQALQQYAKTEKWPLTSQGLFHELKRAPIPRDPSLIDAFTLSPEYHAAYTLLSKTIPAITREQVIDLVCEGEWKALSDLPIQLRLTMEITPEHKRAFLLSYLNNHSKLAAKLLLDTDLDFALKRLDDNQILTILDLYTDKTPILETFSKELLASPRTDAVWKRAAAYLYACQGEALPEPYSHQLALQRFLPAPKAPEQPLIVQTAAPIPPKTPPSKQKKKMHTVEPGDNLWKIARKYHTTVAEIMRANRMETEKLKTGKQIEIPEKTDKR